MNDLRWKNNAIQFPRLIDAAIAADAFTLDVQQNMSQSMGLELAKIDELMARATKEVYMGLSGIASKPEKSYKGLSLTEQQSNGDYQRDVETMSRQNVYYCVSYLVSEMAKDEKYQEDLWPVMGCDDWEEPGQWFIENDMTLDQIKEWFVDYASELKLVWAGHEYKSELELMRQRVSDTLESASETLCDQFNIEPYQIEAYEHWIVSDWFADKLEAQGEMVLKDFHGLTIWGRTTTGQAIHMDSVICNIYNELNAGDI